MILFDTSIWIDYLKKSSSQDSIIFDSFLDNNQVAICGVIMAEIIPFLKTSHEKYICENLFNHLPFLTSTYSEQKEWQEIINYQQQLLKNGLNNVGIPDLMIISLAKQYEMAIYTKDKHFKLAKNILNFEIFETNME